MRGNGDYEAEIHTVWLDDSLRYMHLAFYDETLFGEYYIDYSLGVEQLCYLAPFSTPTREGKAFIGWCDEEGHLIDAVTYYDFFEKLPEAQSIEDRNWDNPIICKVYACWSDGTGGTPTSTVSPTATPRTNGPSATPYYPFPGQVPERVVLRSISQIVPGYYTAYELFRGTHDVDENNLTDSVTFMLYGDREDGNRYRSYWSMVFRFDTTTGEWSVVSYTNHQRHRLSGTAGGLF